MKNFLLPLAAVLVSATAFAEEVTVKYYGNVFKTEDLSTIELFKPTTHEVVANSDGSYTIKKFLNATNNIGQFKDVTFSFTDAGSVSYVGYSPNNYQTLSLSPNSITNVQYYSTMISAIDNSEVSFAAQLYYPRFDWYTPAKVEKLGEESSYTYHVILGSGLINADIPNVPGADQFKVGLYAGFCAVFDMVPKSESGIADVIADEDAPAEWFNLQGVRVNGDNLAPGIYVKRQGTKTVKVLVK